MHPAQVTEPVAYYAKGPCWWPRLGVLRFVDLLAGRVLTLDERRGLVTAQDTGSRVAACVRPRATGGAIIATERGLAIAGRDDLSDLQLWGELFADIRQRFNDGGCDPDGRLHLGTTGHSGQRDIAVLYRVDPGAAAAVVEQSGLSGCHGLAWSPDGRTAYLNDAVGGLTIAYDYTFATGLGNPRPFASYDGLRPDGITVDGQGGVWVCLNGAGLLRRYTADGELSAEVAFPVSQVTACAFGGERYDTLYVTSARANLRPGQEPEAGSVWAVEPGVRGLPPLPFSGPAPRHYT